MNSAGPQLPLHRHLHVINRGTVLFLGPEDEIAHATAIAKKDMPPKLRIEPCPIAMDDDRRWPVVDYRPCEAVIVVERDLAKARAINFESCKAFKDRDIPVIFGTTRELFFETPGWGEVHFMEYKSMFRLVSTMVEPGDYAEFGAFDGRTVTLAWHCFRHALDRLYVFDSFGGILHSQPEEQRIEIYADGDYYANEATFWHNMKTAGVPADRVQVVKGDILETTRQPLPDMRISVLHIDCDVYAPAKAALDFATDHLTDRAFILFDDWDSFWGDDAFGERRAVKEWLAEHPEIILTPYRPYSNAAMSFLFTRRQ